MVWVSAAEAERRNNHEAVVAYLADLGFSKDEVVFVDKLREIRHGTKYYGKSVDVEYAQKVREFLDVLYSKLKKIASE